MKSIIIIKRTWITFIHEHMLIQNSQLTYVLKIGRERKKLTRRRKHRLVAGKDGIHFLLVLIKLSTFGDR